MQTAIKITPTTHLAVHQRLNRYDPTKTTVLRTAFMKDMRLRFTTLQLAIRRSIVNEDCFGLRPGYERLRVLAEPALAPSKTFDFPRIDAKVHSFMEWLEQQQQTGILEVEGRARLGQSIDQAWTDKYLKDSYQRGVQRARHEMLKSGYEAMRRRGLEPAIAGGIQATLDQPPHLDRLGMVYTRAFNQLKGITAQMDVQISHILAQGLADGDHPSVLARKLLATIDGKGAGTLGITDSLGRFIPAKRRALMLARTETIRAHSWGLLQEAKNWGIHGVRVVAEFTTAGYNVCPICQELEGKDYRLDDPATWNLIPVHPNCRCSWRFLKVEKTT